MKIQRVFLGALFFFSCNSIYLLGSEHPFSLLNIIPTLMGVRRIGVVD